MMKSPTTVEKAEAYDYEAHIDHLIDLADQIKIDEVTMLVGANSSGKSFLRKMMSFEGIKVASTSMQARTSSNPEWGGLSAIMQDSGWLATSYNSVHLLQGLLKSNDGKFIVIDEPEIGCGDEVILGVCDHINQYVRQKRKEGTFKGLLIITHNRLVIRNITKDNFIDVNGRTLKEWMARPIKPISIETLKCFGGKLHHAIQDRMNKNKK